MHDLDTGVRAAPRLDAVVRRHYRPVARINYAGMLLHEYGHIAGLAHADGGVMSVDFDHPVLPPGACWKWATAIGAW